MFRQRQHKQGRQIMGIRATGKQTRHVYVHRRLGSPRVGVSVDACACVNSNSGDFISSEDVASCLGTAESCLDTPLVNGAGVRDAATRADVSRRIHMQNIGSAAQRSQREQTVRQLRG